MTYDERGPEYPSIREICGDSYEPGVMVERFLAWKDRIGFKVVGNGCAATLSLPSKDAPEGERVDWLILR